MIKEFPYPLYYLGLLIATIFLSRFLFGKYIQFAKMSVLEIVILVSANELGFPLIVMNISFSKATTKT